MGISFSKHDKCLANILGIVAVRWCGWKEERRERETSTGTLSKHNKCLRLVNKTCASIMVKREGGRGKEGEEGKGENEGKLGKNRGKIKT